MSIKEEILKIWENPSSYDATKFNNDCYHTDGSVIEVIDITSALYNGTNANVSDKVKKYMLEVEWNNFMGDETEEDLKRWKAFCKWCDSFNWTKGLIKEDCINVFNMFCRH